MGIEADGTDTRPSREHRAIHVGDQRVIDAMVYCPPATFLGASPVAEPRLEATNSRAVDEAQRRVEILLDFLSGHYRQIICRSESRTMRRRLGRGRQLSVL